MSEENEQLQANRVWITLAKQYPDNGNVNYRAGISQLETGQNIAAALRYLQTAKEAGVNKNYDRFSPLENKSPVEMHYYLGKAYHLNYKFEEAKLSYMDFMQEASPKHFLRKSAELGIRQSSNALNLVQNKVDYEIVNLGGVINTAHSEFSPVISVDENALFFTSSRVRPDSSNLGVKDRITGEYFNDIYVAYKNRAGQWQAPELLDINEPAHTATVGVSADGQTLYVYRDDNGIGNLYESKLVGELWTEVKKLGGGINSNSWETHIAVSLDNQYAYFVSNRPGGIGGRDIYRVKRLPNGEWSAAQNVGPSINTPYEEDAVFLSPDGQTLYFSSEGHNSMGGFDIFYSVYDDEKEEWGTPKNIGYPINSPGDDVFFVTSADGSRGYFSSIREKGFGKKDIYVVSLPSERDIRLALLMGTIFNADGSKIPEGISISVANKNTGSTDIYTPRSRDGGFVAILPPCNSFEVEYRQGSTLLATDTFSVSCASAYSEIRKELALRPLRINPDGTGSILYEKEPELVVSTTTGNSLPASFKKYFGYNENVVELEEEIFRKFMEQVQRFINTNGRVDIDIVGSASRVPTRTHGSNEKLAEKRAQNAKQRILKSASALGLDQSKIHFTQVKGVVGGPAYSAGNAQDEDVYKKFQFIDITAK